MVSASVLLVFALGFWIRAWSESWGPSATVIVGAGMGLTSLGPDPVERLLQLKQLARTRGISRTPSFSKQSPISSVDLPSRPHRDRLPGSRRR